jgi:hypothetical protein
MIQQQRLNESIALDTITLRHIYRPAIKLHNLEMEEVLTTIVRLYIPSIFMPNFFISKHPQIPQIELTISTQDYPWVPYDEWNNSNPRNISPPASVSSPSTTTNTTPESVERHPPACKCESKDLAASKLQVRSILPLCFHKLTIVHLRDEENKTAHPNKSSARRLEKIMKP